MQLAYSLGNHSARFAGDVTFARHLRSAVAAGFTSVEVDDWTFAGGELRADPHRLASLLSAHEAACATFGPLRVGDAASTEAAMDVLEPVLHAVHPPWVPTVVYDRGPTTVGSLRRCADRAREAGSGLAIEFIPWTAAATLDEARALAAAVGRPSVKILVDTFHVGCGSATWTEVESLAADEIAMVQLSDVRLPVVGDLQHASSHRRLLPGDGDLDLSRFGRALVAKGWDGLVSLEVLSEELRRQDPVRSTSDAWRCGVGTVRGWARAEGP